MALRKEYKDNIYLIYEYLDEYNITIQIAVLIETLVKLGAEVRWSSCNIFQRRIMPAKSLTQAYLYLLKDRRRILVVCKTDN